MDANAIAQVAPGSVGIHLIWSGPPSWVYAPSGFTIQRRTAERIETKDCVQFDAQALTDLHAERERRLSFGVLTVRDGEWVHPLDPAAAPTGHTPCQVFRVDLDTEHRAVRVTVTAKLSFATALCDGRVVAVSGPSSGQAGHDLRAHRIDAVVIVAAFPTMLRICVDLARDDAADWQQATTIVKGLTLPFRELMPALADDAAELAEARSRLRPGESIGAEEFARLAAAIRPVLRAVGPPRPSELALLLRDPDAGAQADADADEVRGLDPLRVLLAHPVWRRALGFSYFDDDPTLVQGESYEYRIAAVYPAADISDRNHGFANVPSGSLLPTDFSLDGIRVRLPRPTTVALAPDTPPDGLARVTRRGIPLAGERESFWLTPSLDDWSAVIDLPAPAKSLVLELADGHDLAFAADSATGPFANTDPVPAGTVARLDFGAPAEQVRLKGTGFLHAIRIPTVPDAKAVDSIVLPPVVLADTPLPQAPLSVSARNLQQPTPATSDIIPLDDVPPRHEPGFEVSWRPAAAFGLTVWPPDADAPPPLDATSFEIERRTEPAGAWLPILPDDNTTFGNRDNGIRDVRLHPGTELAEVFLDRAGRPGASDLDLTTLDVLDEAGQTSQPAQPTPGDVVRYRIRAIDAIGRPSANWTESAPQRLEKWVPPPLPVGPGLAGASDTAGVQVRVLVRGAADLSPDEEALLGTSDNVIVLRWGWHDEQRTQDPLAREFRLYSGTRQDVVIGVVSAVTTLSSGQVTSYSVQLQLDRAVPANAAAGLRLNAGHPFFIRSHDAGQTITMVVETRLRVAGAAPVPATGPIQLDVPLTPDRSRPPAWSARIATVPITSAEAYEHVLRDQLTLTPSQPSDSMWLGVSSADDQSYVSDQLAPTQTRPGNESAIVAVVATGRYAGRPELEIPPPLAPVPVVRTPEPGSEPLHFTLDLTSFIPSAAMTGRVRHERVAAGTLVDACEATADGRILGRVVEPSAAGDVPVEIPIPNPTDQAELAAGLRAGLSTEVADRFLVYLAGHHPYRDRLFTASHDQAAPPGPFDENLPPSPGRWLYRVRGVDDAGHVSAGSATAQVVVIVPSRSPGAPPSRAPRQPGDAANLLRVRVPSDPSLTHLLVFHAPSVGRGPVPASEIVRVPNRQDLLPDGGIWLHSPDGVLLTPTPHALSGPDVVTDPNGNRELVITVPGGPAERTRVWLSTLTADGIPSVLAGPYTLNPSGQA